MKPRPIPIRLKSLTRELDQCLLGCRSVLEIGCGEDSPAQYLSHRYNLVGMDLYEPALIRAKAKGFLKDYVLGDALSIRQRFGPKHFDAVIALDLIEHLDKSEGSALIESMESVASKRIVVFTPNGFLPQPGDENPWMEHKSGWETREFTERGFRVLGINGWKKFRGSYARIVWEPRWFWGAISELSHYLWTRNHPETAFSLLAVKEIR